MRLVLGALLCLLTASCAAPADRAADGAGGAGPTVDGDGADVGAAEEAIQLSTCEEGCMQFHDAGCENMVNQCKPTKNKGNARTGYYVTTCVWAIRLACGNGVWIHECFKECNGD